MCQNLHSRLSSQMVCHWSCEEVLSTSGIKTRIENYQTRRGLCCPACARRGHLGAKQGLVQVARGPERTVQEEAGGGGWRPDFMFPELRALCGDSHSNSCGSGKVFLCPQELAGWPPPLTSSEALGEQGAAKGPRYWSPWSRPMPSAGLEMPPEPLGPLSGSPTC